jgi:two-component system sensor histidine kinase KdpD
MGLSRGALAWILWSLVLATVTALLLPSRFEIEQAHVVLIYLLVVLGGSITGGRALGLSIAFAAFLLIDYFFQPPFDQIAIGKPLDLLILGSFLATAGAATYLLARAQAEAAEAGRRADEVATLARIGSEGLSAGRAEDALGAIAAVIRTTLRAAECQIYRADESGELRLAAGAAGTAEGPEASLTPVDRELWGWVAAEGRGLAVRSDGSVAPLEAGDGGPLAADLSDTRTLLVPLRVRTRLVGALRVADPDRIAVGAAEQRFVDALAYYAALGVERVRLVAEAERAEALRESNRLKDVLLASVSHDLRTPLTAIKALAQDAGANGHPAAQAIEQEADRLTRMVGDLLDLSRIRGGALPVQLEENTAEDLVGAATNQLAGLLQGRELVVDIDLSRPALVGRFDFVQSLRILCNLLENALRYSPPGRPVELSVRQEAAFLHFRVLDRGPGIPPAERERIFEPFYRPAGSQPDAGRAGLGLSIAKRLAEMQGGFVRYEPRSGGGSVFVAGLPAVELAHPIPEEAL